MYLIRNHAEASVEAIDLKNISNMIGHNFRLGEIECAIGIEQLKKLDFLVQTRRLAAKKLSENLSKLKGLKTPIVKEDCTHSYYMFFMQLDISIIGISRDRIYEALIAEGIQGLSRQYVNLHLLPFIRKK